MARVLIAVWPFPTHLHPSLAIARALRERNHEVGVYTSASISPLIESEQLRCFPFQSVNWPAVQRTVDRLVRFRRRPLAMARSWREFLVRTVPGQLEDLKPLLDRWRPDALVCDLTMWAPILVLYEKTRIPVAVLSHVAVCLLPGAGALVTGTALDRSRDGRKGLPARAVAWVLRLFAAGMLREAGGLRSAHGLPPLTTGVTEFSGTLPLYLVPGTPELDRNRQDLPASVHYVGPCLWDNRADRQPAWLDQVPRDRPWVVAEEGALYTREAPLLAAASRALADLPVQGIVIRGLGRAPGSLTLDPAGPDVRVESWTPLGYVLPHASALITNGNSESVLAALLAGVPMVVTPSLMDQCEIAKRVEESGCGLRVPLWLCRPGRLRAAVQRVLAETGFRRNAQRLGAALAGRGGPARAARLVEGLVVQKER